VRDRAVSLETEYAVWFRPAPGSSTPGADYASGLVDQLVSLQVSRGGLPGHQFLTNGSRFYRDQGHAEWSLPECRGAFEAAVYDRAADAAVAELAAEVERKYAAAGRPGLLRIVKNNVDADGHTWGCHENYTAQSRTTWLPDDQEHLRWTVRVLAPFLVTRQVLCGAGRFGIGRRGESPRFQLSQRADFIEAVVGTRTQEGRALFNLGREGESFSPTGFRRLHLILGDANVSSWSTYLKLGTTALVLRLLEDVRIAEVPHLADPVAALRTISHDPSCRARVPLRDGRALTAVEVQRVYLDAILDELDRPGLLSADERRVVAVWGEMLDSLAGDTAAAVGKIDWVTKKFLMERTLQHEGLRWDQVTRNSPAWYQLVQLDIQYHNLSPDEGLYRRLEHGGGLPVLVPESAWRPAIDSPPPHTRARVRGDVVRLARRASRQVGITRWDSATLNGRAFDLRDPLAFFDPAVFGSLGGVPNPAGGGHADS
jgi:proteasome accessory factor A